MRLFGRVLDERGELAPDHQAGERAAVGVRGRGGSDDATPPQDIDAVGDFEHLVELVRNENDAEPLRRQPTQRPQ